MNWSNTIKVLEDMGIESIEMLRKKLDKPDPFSSNATYTLYNSASYRIEVDSKSLKLLLELPESEKDKTTGKLFIEQGRKPGTYPPIRVIKKWVIDRNINISPYAIQKSIFRKGIKPKPYIAEIKRDILIGRNVSRLEQAILDDVKELFKV